MIAAPVDESETHRELGQGFGTIFQMLVSCWHMRLFFFGVGVWVRRLGEVGHWWRGN